MSKITIDRAVLEQAQMWIPLLTEMVGLDPETTSAEFSEFSDGRPASAFTIANVIAALRAALEQPRVEQSSVVGVIGWKNHLPNSGTVVHWTALMPPLGTKLYTHPQPKREPLTDEQITELADAHMEAFAQFVGAGEVWFEGEKEFARAIELAHGITGE